MQEGTGASQDPLRFLAVLIGMRFRGFICMHPGLTLVAACGVRMVRGLLVLAGLVLLRCLVVVLGGLAAVY